MEAEIGDIVIHRKNKSTVNIGIVLKIVDKSSMWFPTADILYTDGSMGWSYLMDLEVISFIEKE